MKTDCVEVRVVTAVDPGELVGRMREEEPLGAWQDENILHLFWPVEKWHAAILSDLRCVLSELDPAVNLESLSVRTVGDQDWNAVWLAAMQPIKIGRQFRIRQSWNRVDPLFAGIELLIDPRRAFGSGYHATTQLLVEWLEDSIRGGERVLDIGTGSGILAMAALRLGAASACGIDNDPEAIECAQENAQANGFNGELKLQTSSLERLSPGQYDLVVANLDRKTILELCPLIRSYLKEGHLAYLSGLQNGDFQDVREAFSIAGGRIEARREREEWIAVSVVF
jgi:ribosomal protein L11 methyltransferase